MLYTFEYSAFIRMLTVPSDESFIPVYCDFDPEERSSFSLEQRTQIAAMIKSKMITKEQVALFTQLGSEGELLAHKLALCCGVDISILKLKSVSPHTKSIADQLEKADKIPHK